MCELFGISASKNIKCNEILSEFFSHGVRHPHGWGITFCDGKRIKIEKEAVASYKSSLLKSILEKPIEANLLLAHIRLATKGNIEYKNTHPFIRKDESGREWVLQHNGTVFESEVLAKYVYKQEGSTDSERILYYLIEQINDRIKKKGESLSEAERSEVVEEVIKVISPENKMNLIISDGELLFVHMNYKDSLYRKEIGDGLAGSETDTDRPVDREGRRPAGSVVIATTPLDGGSWTALPLNTLLVYRDGELIYTGEKHEHEYTDDPEKMKYLYLDFAAI